MGAMENKYRRSHGGSQRAITKNLDVFLKDTVVQAISLVFLDVVLMSKVYIRLDRR